MHVLVLDVVDHCHTKDQERAEYDLLPIEHVFVHVRVVVGFHLNALTLLAVDYIFLQTLLRGVTAVLEGFQVIIAPCSYGAVLYRRLLFLHSPVLLFHHKYYINANLVLA